MLAGPKKEYEKVHQDTSGPRNLVAFPLHDSFLRILFSSILFMPSPGGEESGPPFFFAVFIALHLFTMLWLMGLTVFYMVNVFRNDRVDKDKKVLWAVVIFMGNMIAMPIYWYLYIWKEVPAGTSDLENDARPSNREQYVPPIQPPN